METKNTKQRLDDLQELLQAGYLTENEFRVARINALRENGVDIVIHGSRKPEVKRVREEEEEEPRGCGCGCLLAVLLVIVIGAGAVFFASKWPEFLGGSYLRTVRGGIADQWSSFFSDEPSGALPDPADRRNVSLPAIVVIVSDDQVASPMPSPDAEPGPSAETPPAPEARVPTTRVSTARVSTTRVSTTPVSTVLATTTEPAAPPAPETLSASETPAPEARAELAPPPAPSADPLAGRVSLPSLDARIFVLPNIESSNVQVSNDVTVEEPNVIVVEIPNVPSGSSSGASSEPRRGSAEGEPGKPLRRGVVSARSARIRTAPDTSRSDNIVGWGNRGDRFSVLEEGTGRDGSTWYRIRYEEGSKQGWISGTLVTLEKVEKVEKE
ncbi:MAG: SH3 domain-containing protein [Synergistaceae bacterium]|nr:SH3 domain-containing protein [Synergistaceae bacterium]